MKKLPEFLRHIKGDLDGDNDEPVELLLAEPIGFDPSTYNGMSSKQFGLTLNSISKKKDVRLYINTLGGLVDEGVAMHNMILARGNVDTCVIGYAASAGAIVAQAGRKRQMMPGTMMVIHNVQGGQDGDYKDLQAASERVKKVNDNIVDLLSSRTGQSKRKISEMMDATTMMTPDECKELGFCDEVVDGAPIYNDLAKEVTPGKALKGFRQLISSNNIGAAGEADKHIKQPTMNKLLAALVAAGLIDQADTTDEQAAARFAERIKNRILDGVPKNEVEGLRNRITQFENSQKTRVEGKVNLAVTNKLVKEDRKAALIAMGQRDETELDAYLADLESVRNEAQPPAGGTRRGAPPVPPTKEQGADETESKIATLQDRMKNCSPAERVTIAREIRTLRGHKNLFESPAK